jgi:hypothetical protein
VGGAHAAAGVVAKRSAGITDEVTDACLFEWVSGLTCMFR